MSREELVKPCPICEDEMGQMKTVETAIGIDWNAFCNHCCLELDTRTWNAMPRRGEIYSELMGLALDLESPNSGFTRAVNIGHRLAAQDIRALALKYQPEGDTDE